MNMKKAVLQLETLACPTCMQKITGALKSVPGVDQESVRVLFNASKAKLTFDETVADIKDISQAVIHIGYDVLKASIQ